MMIILDHYNGNDNENGNDNSDEEKKETRYMRNKGGLKKKIKKWWKISIIRKISNIENSGEENGLEKQK